MALTLVYFLVGSVLLALLVSWQVKHVAADWLSIAKFYLYSLPILFLANTALALGYARAHAFWQNLTAAVAGQTLIYYLFLLLFSIVILGDKVSLARSLIGIGFIVAGIYILKLS